ncbi:MAG: hypothetical protein AAGJ29_06930, partial [Pseudomonadota bacterium]
GGADFVNGGEGTDTVLFSAGGAVEIDLDENGDAVASVGDTVTSIENITGSAAGDDTIAGNSSVNVLNGNGGNDTIDGEGGDDTLSGGTGADTFIEAEGSDADTVTDFVVADDVIDVTGHGLTADEALALAVDDGSGNAFIDFGDGDTITLTGVDVATLTAANFDGTAAAPASASASASKTGPVSTDLSDDPEIQLLEEAGTEIGNALDLANEATNPAFTTVFTIDADLGQAVDGLESGLESPPVPLSGTDLGDSL